MANLRGFTLVEAIVNVFLLTTLFTGALSTFLMGLNLTRRATFSIYARRAVEGELAKLKFAGYDTLSEVPLHDTGKTATLDAGSPDTADDDVFAYVFMEAERVDMDEDGTPDDVKLVTVEMRWEDLAGKHSEEIQTLITKRGGWQ